MKQNPPASISAVPPHGYGGRSAAFRLWLVCAWLLIAGSYAGQAAELQVIHAQTSAVVTNLAPNRHSSRWNRLNLSIGLPLRDRAGLTNLLEQLYDPASTNYHRFLTSAQFAERFGPSEKDYEAVVNFARAHGLAVTGRHPNRTLVSVRGTVADVERAFHVNLNEYPHPKESRTFYAPDREPSIDLAVPVLAVGGLDNYVIPRPCLTPIPAGQPGPNLTGSGPNGAFLGNDFRAAYVPGVPLTGIGQTVGLLEFDSGYFQSDITAYETLAGLPNVPVSPVLLDGYNGAPGGGNDEVSLDIEMAISLAPGLNGILVYEGSTTDDILNRMATDNLAKQIGASWTYPIDANSEQAFLQLAAQGQSFFNASGDSDAYPGAIDTPADDPNITIVGGTTLTTTGAGGAWASETVWNWGGGVGSSGGISTAYPIPSWQQGVITAANQGSSTMRNLPDVALTADNVYVIYGGGKGGAFGGTSCATPLWAAFIALANQLALTNGEPTVGFINPLVYAMGKGSNSLSYTSLFHDITTGNNESSRSPNRFSAVPGYDLCTGWGTPLGSNLIAALALPEPLRISPAGDVIITGPVGGPFTPAAQTYSLTNNGSSPLNWGLGNISLWVNVAPVGGALIRGNPATTVAISATSAATNLPAGSYSVTLWFTNLTDGFVQTRHAIIDVVTPPVITAQPANQALLVGMTANFSVSIGSNALMYYQWRENGTNLSDVGNISGSGTGALSISDVTSNNIGVYSVILSNAAGVLASSNASLTIVPSAPVIVLQPASQSILPGAPASFSVAAVGNTPYFYRWQFAGTNLSNGVNISGATSGTLTVSNVTAANAGVYSVTVSNTLGFTTSTGALLSIIPVTVPGVTLSTLWSFTDGNSGEFLYSPLAQGKDGNFYGTTLEGGVDGDGTVFKYATNGTLSTLFSFNGNNGALPYGGLFLGRDNFFYGTVFTGGTYGDGMTFRVTTAGALTVLSTFTGNNGMLPVAGMVQGLDGNFYGTALEGGPYGFGTVYRMTTGGVLTTLAAFNNLDGAYPSPVLVQGSDGNFYGTTENGGTNGAGTVFKMTPAGTLTSLYSFSGGNDGAIPVAGLVQGTDGNFYGVAYEGGANGAGTVFKITASGSLTTLYSFTGGSDGELPWGGLVQAADGNLYGTTQSGGTYGFGTVFQIAPAGALNTIAQFDGFNGANPSAALIQASDGNLYGTTETGGSAGDGAIFRIGVSGPLQITGEPTDQAAYTGGTAIFTVATSGSAPVHYQWQQDGINLTDGGNISGSATATLSLTNVTVADAALYTVVVSNAFNSLTSDYAILEIVYSPPDITQQPASQTRVAGTTATFSVTAAGDQPLAYQWQDNGTNLSDGGAISGSATSTLTLANVSTASQGHYSVIVSNALFSVPSAQAVLTVVPATAPSAALNDLRLFSGTTDGAFPYAGLIQGKDGYLYGLTEAGGSHFYGSSFRLPVGGGLSTIYNFSDGTTGANPYARLVQGTNGIFYGTTAEGGTNGYGTLFKMTTGAAVTFLYSFADGNDGANPETGLTQGADGNFYGASEEGGADSVGTIYKMNPNGGVTALYEFTGLTDGAYPLADLVQGRDGNFYGTTIEGGQSGFGTVFSLATNGTLTTLISFSYTNGAYPEAGVIQGVDGSFYGTTTEGGPNGYGTIFSLATNGALTTLYSFGNTNGSGPAASLVQGNDGNLYGTCSAGGAGGQGTAFRISTNGALTTLVWFDGLNGASPQAAMIQATDGNFYGTTPFGGTGYNPSAGGGNGTLYRLTVPIFISSPFSAAAAVACLPYSSSLSGKAVAPAGDTLSYAKVSGPAWLNVATNGVLSGTPTNSDIGTNIFVARLTDTNGMSAAATLSIMVIADPPPTFLSNPFAEPWANLDEDYVQSISTNATAPFLGIGDILSFAKVSGPAWLEVAANGLLSGIPDVINAGTNNFVVSVTDLGGASNTAILVIYVNSPPMFSPPDFNEPAGTVGVPYAGTIATNAVDPDLAAGDSLTFYKVTGPNWLGVATNGALSGVPASADVGAGVFLVLAVDSGGLSGIGSMIIHVNPDVPPVFDSNPFGEPPALAGQPYSATIAINASDAVAGDQLTFSKISGPAWLNVASNGSLSGLPLSTNAGANSFVVSAADLGGLSTNATMFINVTAVPLAMTIGKQSGNLLLRWSGGVPPYQLQTTINPGATSWQNLGSATSLTNLMLSPSNAGVFYRVQSQ
jgi:uncharacterized repeat protein (TIGR03803 family)